MSADAATADGEHFAADPFGRRGNGFVLDFADLHDRFVVSRRYVVRFPRIPPGLAASSRSLDRDGIKLRQVSLSVSLFLPLSLYNIIILYHYSIFGYRNIFHANRRLGMNERFLYISYLPQLIIRGSEVDGNRCVEVCKRDTCINGY